MSIPANAPIICTFFHYKLFSLMNKQVLLGILLIIISSILVMAGVILKLNNYSAGGIVLNIGLVFWLISLLYFSVLIGIKLLKPSK